MNTSVVAGIPQHRERIYIVGMWRSLAERPNGFKFTWPTPVSAPPLSRFLSPNTAPAKMPQAGSALESLLKMWGEVKEKQGDDPQHVMYSMDVCASEAFGTYMREASPTITRARAGVGGYFLSAWRRMMTQEDLRKLQGFPANTRRGHATDRQFQMMLGNAMTVPVLARVLYMVLNAAGYIDDGVSEFAAVGGFDESCMEVSVASGSS